MGPTRCLFIRDVYTWDQQDGPHVGPRWAPCWPHEPCYQGAHSLVEAVVVSGGRYSFIHSRRELFSTQWWRNGVEPGFAFLVLYEGMHRLMFSLLLAWTNCWTNSSREQTVESPMTCNAWRSCDVNVMIRIFIVRRAGLLWSQQDFEWLWSVPLSSASLY